MKIHYDAMGIANLIKGLLSLGNGYGCSDRYVITTIESRVEINLLGDGREAQREIHKWLSVPERMENFKKEGE